MPTPAPWKTIDFLIFTAIPVPAGSPSDLASRASPAGLGFYDWAVLAGYFVLLAGMGVFLALRARRRTSTSGYFLGGGRMPVWAVAISFLATAQSAATVLGVPEDAYRGDLRYLSTNIGGILAAMILAWWFIPAYYRAGVTTPYQLLEQRFGPGAKMATSAAYLVGRVLASGARVFIGSVPVAMAIFGTANGSVDPGHVAVAVVIFMIFGALFTLAGGLTSVIWTDVVQVAVYVGGAVLVIVVLWRGVGMEAGAVLDAVRHGAPDGGSKLRFLSLGVGGESGFRFSEPYTLITACTGWTLLMLAAYGTDQDLVQRLLATRDSRQGGWSVISGVLMGIPTVLIFAVIGLLLWVYYHAPGRTPPAYVAGDTGEVFLKFTLREMPAGMAGLVIAGIMAAGPAGINASLNSMATTFVSDFYKPLRPGRPDAHYVSAGRWATAGWAVALGVFALVCIAWKQANNEAILPFVLGVMGFAYAGMLGVFLTALFTRRGTTHSAVAALLVGFVAVTAMQPALIRAWWPGELLAMVIPKANGSAVPAPELAAPWRLVIGTVLSTAVAAFPRGRPRGGRTASPVPATPPIH